MAGVRDFKGYNSRQSPFEGKGATITTVDPIKVVSAHKQTKIAIADACPFGQLMSRDNLYQRQHGLPKETKEQSVKRKKVQKEYVSAVDFLPNNIMKSPQKNLNSSTVKT